MSALEGDDWIAVGNTTLYGQNTNEEWRLGDRIEMRIVGVDPEQGHISSRIRRAPAQHNAGMRNEAQIHRHNRTVGRRRRLLPGDPAGTQSPGRSIAGEIRAHALEFESVSNAVDDAASQALEFMGTLEDVFSPAEPERETESG